MGCRAPQALPWVCHEAPLELAGVAEIFPLDPVLAFVWVPAFSPAPALLMHLVGAAFEPLACPRGSVLSAPSLNDGVALLKYRLLWCPSESPKLLPKRPAGSFNCCLAGVNQGRVPIFIRPASGLSAREAQEIKAGFPADCFQGGPLRVLDGLSSRPRPFNQCTLKACAFLTLSRALCRARKSSAYRMMLSRVAASPFLAFWPSRFMAASRSASRAFLVSCSRPWRAMFARSGERPPLEACPVRSSGIRPLRGPPPSPPP